MNQWDKLIYSIVVLALVAVVISTGKTAGAIGQIGAAIKQLVQNIVGVKQNG